MNPERWEQIKQVYHSALGVEPGRREEFLKKACAGDESLFKEVTSLLAQKENSEGLFEVPALEVVAKALAEEEAHKPRLKLTGHTLLHYRIEKKIGEGGMGEVFLAQDTSLNRKVALKFLPPEMQQDPVAHKRFLREARSAAALDNPYICSIHEVGESEGKDFIVMEYVDGQTLAEKLRRAPAISRQGNRLAYGVGKGDANIYRVDLIGLGLNREIPFKFISSTRDESCSAYSPDGKKIAFSSDRSGSWEIWVCDLDGSNAVQVTSLGGMDLTGPKWSPDGRSLVFGLHVGGDQHIFTADANGGAPRRLMTDPVGSMPWPSWSHDGRSIYFRSKRSGWSAIWKMSATGGDAIQITPDGHERDLPQESPDGKYLYYINGDHSPEQCSVWRMPVGGGEETKVVESTNCAGPYAVWEQGIYFLTPPDKQDRSDISLHNLRTGKIRKIVTIEQPGAMFIAASPDGRTILYTQFDQSGSDLMLVENFR